MYSLVQYGKMIADTVRMDAYARALRQTIHPDTVVIDIGSGTGIFALMSCHFGARKVYAIEPDDSLQVAREAAAANGVTDRIELIQDLSTEVTLPERANVIVSDLRGVLPPFRHHLPSIIDARKRLLASGGALIPGSDTLWVAVVSADELYGELVSPWEDRGYGLDLSAGRRRAVNTWCKAQFETRDLLTAPRQWASIDYTAVAGPDVAGDAELHVETSGKAHGLCVWFDTELIGGVGFSNAPGQTPLIYGQAFFPFEIPVDLTEGDTVSASLQARLVSDDYVWIWRTNAWGGNDSKRQIANFSQSTFLGTAVTPKNLRKRDEGYHPSPTMEGRILRQALVLMGSGLSLGDIAKRLAGEFPDRFIAPEDALAYVGDLSQKYCR